jgi:hypothetical protein
MKEILFNLSGKIDQPTVDALLAIKKEADALNLSFFVVGAFARDIILQHCYGINPPRKTGDIDLGINVADKDTAKEIMFILNGDTQSVIIDMIKERRMFDSNFETINLQLEKLKQGFTEAAVSSHQ